MRSLTLKYHSDNQDMTSVDLYSQINHQLMAIEPCRVEVLETSANIPYNQLGQEIDIDHRKCTIKTNTENERTLTISLPEAEIIFLEKLIQTHIDHAPHPSSVDHICKISSDVAFLINPYPLCIITQSDTISEKGQWRRGKDTATGRMREDG